jgi:hypothetical protein
MNRITAIADASQWRSVSENKKPTVKWAWVMQNDGVAARESGC